MDGLEATSRLRAWEKGRPGRRVFVVGMSAHDDPETQRRFHEAGCDLFLVRPVEPEQILSVLRRVSRSSPDPARTG